jgi:vancomycin permeability regulator SanA
MIYKLRKLKRLAWITFPVMLIFSIWFAHFKIEKTTQHLVYNDVRAIIRLNKIFGQEQCTIISQEFHNKRAIYIANRLGLNAVGFNAKDVDAHIGFKTKLRECFARVKVFLDFWVHKEPTYLGQQVEIE